MIKRLSSPTEYMKPQYDVVVVGSGYGAAIAASRLARAGRKVCVLERGPERLPGEFPDTVLEAGAETQTHSALGRTGARTALFDFSINDDLVVLTGCGLGGTSLINANVSLRADPRVFDDPVWPAEVRADRARLAECHAMAEHMLGAQTYPDTQPTLAKYTALQRSGERLGLPVMKVPINVTFKDGPNAAGVEQRACTLCGDCVSGCNHSAKNTTQMNYLPDAVRHGVEIFTCVHVDRLERGVDGGWLVHFEPRAIGREKFDSPSMFVATDLVVLGAGALGSAEILLRSRAHGLAMSDAVGTHFSGNGDVIGFAYNADQPIHGVGYGTRPVEPGRETGPCITGVIDGRNTPELNAGFIIEEGDVPGPVGTLTPAMYTAAAPFIGQAANHQRAAERAMHAMQSVVGGAHTGATDRTQTFLVMSHDDSQGRVELDGDRAKVTWPDVGKQPHFTRMDDQLRLASDAIGAVYFRNPMWTSMLGDRLITVHPLGGAPMGESASTGAVNHKGQVFSGVSGRAVWDDLYVMDGSVLPRSVGVNPLITISALAERNVALLAADRGWTIDYAPNSPDTSIAEPPVPSLQFTETMRGHWVPGDTLDFKAAAAQGEAVGSTFEFTLTIVADDANDMIENAPNRAAIFGTVNAPGLSPDPLSVTQGEFNLFDESRDSVDERRMRYRMMLRSSTGTSWFLDAFKRVRPGNLLHAWPDTSTLFISIHEGADATGAVVGRGVLRIKPADFQKQLGTMQVRNASAKDRLAITARFGKLFAGVLYATYGTVFGQTSTLHEESAPRKRRALRLPAPEMHPFTTPDGTQLMLTRYHGGSAGPLIAAPGFGTPAASFLLDTVDTTFTEFFVERGYDVWLLDYRASTALPSSSLPFTIDAVATQDWPAAVALVREVTGAPDVQVVGHCVGSLTFLMAQLAGLEGVSSAVCSALTVHPRAPLFTELKAKFRLPSVLSKMGIEKLSTNADHPKWYDRALNEAMRLFPTNERCHSDVCRRILFMYGEVFAHAQLNTATHDALHEVFGVAHMQPFAQLAAATRIGHVVDADEHDTYLPHVDRLNLPITFLHGELNTMFLPEGSRLTYEWLCEHNGSAQYQRIVMPEYAHMDAFIGKDAARDVFPLIDAELRRHREFQLQAAGVAAR